MKTRRLMRNRITTRRVSLSVAAALCCVGGLAALEGGATAGSSGLATAFPVLNTASSTADQLSAGAQVALTNSGAASDVVAGQSRVVATAGAETVWLVPGGQNACLVDSDATNDVVVSCSTAQEAEQAGLLQTTGNRIVGEMPSGVTALTVTLADGSTTTLNPDSHGGVLDQLAQSPSAISYDEPNGTEHRVVMSDSTPGP